MTLRVFTWASFKADHSFAYATYSRKLLTMKESRVAYIPKSYASQSNALFNHLKRHFVLYTVVLSLTNGLEQKAQTWLQNDV